MCRRNMFLKILDPIVARFSLLHEIPHHFETILSGGFTIQNTTFRIRMSNISIGNDLRDSYTETRKWVISNTKWLQDLASFYRERAKLEKEYGDKLSALTKDYFSKKSNGTVVLSVGETPTITPGSLEAASQVAWNEVLTQTETISKDHKKLAKEFQLQIADEFTSLEKRCDQILGTIDSFNHELVNKRDFAYNSLEKAKRRYDESCQAMEAARLKQTKASSTKAQRKLDEREHEMNIAKNDYLIQVNQTNRLKDKYYFQDVPEALDLLQDLNESRIRVMNSIWKKAGGFERELHKRVEQRLDGADEIISQNYPHLDTSMFIKHNFREWKEPDDYQYIPSSVWHDDEHFAVCSDVELHDLKIRLAKAQNSYNRLQLVVHEEMSSLSRLNKKKQDMKTTNDTDPYAFQELLKQYLTTVVSFTTHETSKLEAEVEIESIQNNVSESHDLNTDNIDVSRRSKKPGMFGMFKRSAAVSKCNSGADEASEMSVDITSKSSPKHHGLHLFRTRRTRAVSTESSEIQSSRMDDSSSLMSITNEDNKVGNRVLFPYTKQDADEVTIVPGNIIGLIRQDDGSGWIKIRNITTGHEGFVPSTYVEINEVPTPFKPAPKAPPPRRNPTSLRTVIAVYDYAAKDFDEISIRAGDVIKVIRDDTGNGWTYGEVRGSRGLFPSNYCN
ncbi:Bzz1p Ecym_5426 [Eremothecium cymbalariae DBVPG|uniref:Protein BZZ1 n=1 Tax=Eremothecium cymbalariae (strain CBS 270.75 / DBVPG 7215 / KCTC 17166 / NRRL Y-17582) TaxID=931890 RepID=I6NDN8_ERECY|nr:hypothetical protein Ecym_5426 [Eremothecium cymbalariae DBVPG\